jgi:hypothetical protein
MIRPFLSRSAMSPILADEIPEGSKKAEGCRAIFSGPIYTRGEGGVKPEQGLKKAIKKAFEIF